MTQNYNIVVNSKELIATLKKNLTLYMRCRINQCRYNRVQVCFSPLKQTRIYLLIDPSVQSFGVHSTTSHDIVQRIVFVPC